MGYITRERDTAINIIAIFEQLLNEKGISIPDESRTGSSEEARIFGNTYYELEDKITSEIESFSNKLTKAIEGETKI